MKVEIPNIKLNAKFFKNGRLKKIKFVFIKRNKPEFITQLLFSLYAHNMNSTGNRLMLHKLRRAIGTYTLRWKYELQIYPSELVKKL